MGDVDWVGCTDVRQFRLEQNRTWEQQAGITLFLKEIEGSLVL
jgi:hypothetical protein